MGKRAASKEKPGLGWGFKPSRASKYTTRFSNTCVEFQIHDLAPDRVINAVCLPHLEIEEVHPRKAALGLGL
jgi:hypothetical protein